VAADALSPTLTRYDERVLAALDQWTDDKRPFGDTPLDWRNVWQVAERLREYDVATVRRTLDGLAHLGYAMARDWDHRRRWVAVPWLARPDAASTEEAERS
jgi:hypothetical protein